SREGCVQLLSTKRRLLPVPSMRNALNTRFSPPERGRDRLGGAGRRCRVGDSESNYSLRGLSVVCIAWGNCEAMMNQFGGAAKGAAALLASATLCVGLPTAAAAADEAPPRGAYPANNRSYKPPADDGNLLHVPD